MYKRQDFDSLSPDTKAKLQEVAYKIGESRKVEGNLRAVIVDTTDQKNRVEDLTLRKMTNNNENQVPSDLIDVYKRQVPLGVRLTQVGCA